MTSAWNGSSEILKKSVVAFVRTGASVGGTANGIVNGFGNALSAIRLVPVVTAVTVRSSGKATAPLTSSPIFIKSRRVRVMAPPRLSGRAGRRRRRAVSDILAELVVARVRTTAYDGIRPMLWLSPRRRQPPKLVLSESRPIEDGPSDKLRCRLSGDVGDRGAAGGDEPLCFGRRRREPFVVGRLHLARHDGRHLLQQHTDLVGPHPATEHLGDRCVGVTSPLSDLAPDAVQRRAGRLQP